MSKSLNSVQLIGRIGKEPEFKVASNNMTITSLSLATNAKTKDKATGDYVDRVVWHNVIAFGKTAENLSKYVKKGDKVYIQGSLDYTQYEKDGIKRTSSRILCNDFIILSNPKSLNAVDQSLNDEIPF